MTLTSLLVRLAKLVAVRNLFVTRAARFVRASTFILPAALVISAVSVRADQAIMENLGRGVVATHANATQIYVGWRMLGTDPSDIAFNLYRSTNGGAPELLNSTPITATTDFVDTPPDITQAFSYFVRPVIAGI